MKRLILLALLITLVAGFAAADSQWDITFNVPYYAGFWSSSEDLGGFSSVFLPIPDIKWNYYFGPDWLHFGVGVRLITLLVESATFPIISLESNLGNFIIGTNIGGGAIAYFGIAGSGFLFEPIFLTELSVAYRLGKKKIFSLGTSAQFIFAPVNYFARTAIFIGTGFVRWTF